MPSGTGYNVIRGNPDCTIHESLETQKQLIRFCYDRPNAASSFRVAVNPKEKSGCS